MVIEIYLKGGQTIALDHVEQCEFKHNALTCEFESYSVTWEQGWKRKLTHVVPSQIAAVCRVSRGED